MHLLVSLVSSVGLFKRMVELPLVAQEVILHGHNSGVK